MTKKIKSEAKRPKDMTPRELDAIPLRQDLADLPPFEPQPFDRLEYYENGKLYRYNQAEDSTWYKFVAYVSGSAPYGTTKH